jgi:flagellar biosynthesis protein FlhG
MSSNSGLDQAAGLRSLLGTTETRRVSFLSAIPAAEKNQVLLNLAAALVQKGSDIHLLDASLDVEGISTINPGKLHYSLSDVATGQASLSSALVEHDSGIHLSKLSTQSISNLANQNKALARLSEAVLAIKPESNFCFIDTHLDNDNPFILPEISEGDVVVMATTTADSIKSAYLQIKALHAKLGRRPYHILVVGGSEQQASLIQQNMSQATNLYLAVPLISLGAIPTDDSLARATQMSKSVVEAYPTAPAATAFREIASKLIDHARTISATPSDNQEE